MRRDLALEFSCKSPYVLCIHNIEAGFDLHQVTFTTGAAVVGCLGRLSTNRNFACLAPILRKS